ncbi:hypothetical protein [Desulforegula conservatrix]|uniref:hypothetical protein n=1 Tax=Desulforegula conservatrix TaxID=153026 RepID=UPI00040DA015|nr:hypothetical protein [Desulforegula conservatrix]
MSMGYVKNVSIIAGVVFFLCACQSIDKKRNNTDVFIPKDAPPGYYEMYKNKKSEMKKRWEFVQDNLRFVNVGMKREEVVKFLGEPDNDAFIPANVMQFSVDSGVVEDDAHVSSVHIILDEGQKVIDIQNNNYIYGPPSNCE